LGVVGRHFDCSIGADVGVSAGEGLHGADAARRLQANPIPFEVRINLVSSVTLSYPSINEGVSNG